MMAIGWRHRRAGPAHERTGPLPLPLFDGDPDLDFNRDQGHHQRQEDKMVAHLIASVR